MVFLIYKKCKLEDNYKSIINTKNNNVNSIVKIIKNNIDKMEKAHNP